jgi:hypothetical protein
MMYRPDLQIQQWVLRAKRHVDNSAAVKRQAEGMDMRRVFSVSIEGKDGMRKSREASCDPVEW